MLEVVGASSLDALIDEAIPAGIRLDGPLPLADGLSEHRYLRELRETAARNQVFKSYIGLGYYDCVTPSVIVRNVLENPGWYTPYTPYQAEIAQGRLEALLNFQTMVSDLTGMQIANASLLDEATAAAEAMTMLHRVNARAGELPQFFVASSCFPQTIDVLRTRAEPMGFELVVGDPASVAFTPGMFGALVQTPDEAGRVVDLRAFISRAHDAGILVAVATDLLALTLLTPPGEAGADVVVGSAQRFGVPMGYGGPHAAFFATRVALSVYRSTRTVRPRTGWLCKRASSTFAGRKRRPTSALPRRCWQTSRRCTRSTTARMAWHPLQSAFTKARELLPAASCTSASTS